MQVGYWHGSTMHAQSPLYLTLEPYCCRPSAQHLDVNFGGELGQQAIDHDPLYTRE